MTEKLTKIAIKFSYDGTNYSGLALQPDENNTIAHHIHKSLEKYNFYDSAVVFCGRTDAGVSASNMIASFYIKNYAKGMNVGAMINNALPDEIVIKEWALVDDKFDARRDCRQRHYKYFFSLNEEFIATIGNNKIFENINRECEIMRISETPDRKVKKCKFSDKSCKNITESTLNNDLHCKNILKENFVKTGVFSILNGTQPLIVHKIKSDFTDLKKFCLSELEKSTQSISKIKNVTEYIDIVLSRMDYCIEKIKPLKNFKNFCKKSCEKQLNRNGKNIDEKFYLRTLNLLEIKKTESTDNFFYMNVKARSFLHNMVRKIFYVVFNYGIGLLSDKNINDIIEGEISAGCAQSENLMFCCGFYECEIDFQPVKDKNKAARLCSKMLHYVMEKNRQS
ncbi:tRNA pseudouridine synthase A [Edhazardia aedis USNM 41457]|uniref:tRNA pseudouridine synthase n=1 Tax=Edhazardia aedis (strain USNM 41457) TaxID=1003232 RepID=J9DNE9_EDHAE|nr:tRNA pseudouridine synthase A [Edhazardia aedis USNM 41457]|eukprot:EJW02917.1 tRNA pseudouridine synthase A [Edhazardia aedis USNM 41457]